MIIIILIIRRVSRLVDEMAKTMVSGAESWTKKPIEIVNSNGSRVSEDAISLGGQRDRI